MQWFNGTGRPWSRWRRLGAAHCWLCIHSEQYRRQPRGWGEFPNYIVLGSLEEVRLWAVPAECPSPSGGFERTSACKKAEHSPSNPAGGEMQMAARVLLSFVRHLLCCALLAGRHPLCCVGQILPCSEERGLIQGWSCLLVPPLLWVLGT